MATLHLIHGFVGAGKTTFSRNLEVEIPAMRFTLDEWIVKLYGHNPPEDKFTEYSERVSSLIWQLTRRFLDLGQDVILDFGFWTRASRDRAREFARSVNAEVKLYSICCSDEFMKRRVASRNKDLPSDSLWIDDCAFELFKQGYEALEKDEPHVVIQTS